ncbi:branched-chain amino acid ABC transporter permease [Amycolatopsis lurida]
MDVLLAILSQFGLYGLLTVGIATVFAALRVVNLAHCDFAMIGAYAAATLIGFPFGWRAALVLGATIPLLVLIERVLLRHSLADGLGSMLVTWGVGMALRQLAEVSFGATPRSVTAPVDGSVTVFGASGPAYRLICSLVAVAVIGLVLLAAHRTRWGLTLRAVADNPSMAGLLGTDPNRLRTTAFVAGGLLAVLAGALYSPTLAVSPTMGFSLLVPVFFALLFSRPGSLATAALAALGVSALAVLLRTWLSDVVADALFYVVVFVIAAARSRPSIRRFLSWSRRFVVRSARSPR